MKSIAVSLALLSILTIFSPRMEAAIHTRTIEYRDGDTVLQGYLAWDDARSGKLSGILLVHDWMGVGPYVQRRAHQMAALGYVVFAPDIYGKTVRPTNGEEAARVASTYRSDRQLTRRRARAGLEVLASQPSVDRHRLVAMGYCFGGMVALELARDGADLRGVVSFHGGLSTPDPEMAKNIKGRVLVLHGADDPFVKPDEVLAFQDEMRQAHVDWQFVAYGGAVHAFTIKEAGNDPSKGAAYDERADHRSWEEMKRFLAELP